VVDALRQAVSIVSAGLDYHHIEVKMDMQRGSFFAKESAREFTQMILNLLNNSKDALSKSSKEKRIITITLSQEDGIITLLFCDNAGGIDPEVLPNIFELYVSTKNQAEGSGIGLYMTQLIIEQKMRGSISVKNSTEGACFTLTFPSI
jgi:signal transduction histidine kinase